MNPQNIITPNAAPLSPALYVVSVPIGNLEDITLRALRILSAASKIYCEDTRVTRKLLGLYHIDAPMLIRCDQHSEEKQKKDILKDIQNGEVIALVSDAGTPLISDPGYVICHYLRENNVTIIPVPGACAMTAALSVAGLPTDKFMFLGFPPKKQKALQEFLKEYLTHSATYILYERADRLALLCGILYQHYPETDIVIGREITKKFEEFISGSPAKIIEHLQSHTLKGEVVFCIYHKALETSLSETELENIIKEKLVAGMTVKDIAAEIATIYKLNKKEIYRLTQSLKEQNHE